MDVGNCSWASDHAAEWATCRMGYERVGTKFTIYDICRHGSIRYPFRHHPPSVHPCCFMQDAIDQLLSYFSVGAVEQGDEL